MVDDIRKAKRHKDYDLNFYILMTEIRVREKEIWRNNRFCECNADSIDNCECDPEKQKRFRKRRKRKINEEFDRELSNMMSGRLPQHDSREDHEGYPSNEK
jgi:hypothetical protein